MKRNGEKETPTEVAMLCHDGQDASGQKLPNVANESPRRANEKQRRAILGTQAHPPTELLQVEAHKMVEVPRRAHFAVWEEGKHENRKSGLRTSSPFP